MGVCAFQRCWPSLGCVSPTDTSVDIDQSSWLGLHTHTHTHLLRHYEAVKCAHVSYSLSHSGLLDQYLVFYIIADDFQMIVSSFRASVSSVTASGFSSFQDTLKGSLKPV